MITEPIINMSHTPIHLHHYYNHYKHIHTQSILLIPSSFLFIINNYYHNNYSYNNYYYYYCSAIDESTYFTEHANATIHTTSAKLDMTPWNAPLASAAAAMAPSTQVVGLLSAASPRDAFCCCCCCRRRASSSRF